MKPEDLTTALLIVAALAFVCEVVGLLYCAIRNIPFGTSFGFAVFVQLSSPAAFLAALLFWHFISPSTGGVEPFAGTAWSRGFLLAAVCGGTGFIATIVAGILGISRITHHANDNTRSASQITD